MFFSVAALEARGSPNCSGVRPISGATTPADFALTKLRGNATSNIPNANPTGSLIIVQLNNCILVA